MPGASLISYHVQKAQEMQDMMSKTKPLLKELNQRKWLQKRVKCFGGKLVTRAIFYFDLSKLLHPNGSLVCLSGGTCKLQKHFTSVESTQGTPEEPYLLLCTVEFMRLCWSRNPEQEWLLEPLHIPRQGQQTHEGTWEEVMQSSQEWKWRPHQATLKFVLKDWREATCPNFTEAYLAQGQHSTAQNTVPLQQEGSGFKPCG